MFIVVRSTAHIIGLIIIIIIIIIMKLI